MPDQEEGGSRILFKEAHESDQCCVAAPHNTSLYTTRNTTRYTTLHATLSNCSQKQHFGALRLQRNEMKIQVDFSVLTGNAAPWQRFGSVACSVGRGVACRAVWGLRVVCNVACGCCHVAYFASCSAVCRWRVRHTGGTMRTTNDGWSPGSSWWQEEICKTKNTRIPFLSSVLKFYVPGWRTAKKQRAEAEGCFGHLHWPVRSFMFELKVMEPGAFKFDYIATQAGQSSAGMPENGCRTRRREEAKSFSKKLMKVTRMLRGSPTQHVTIHYTQHYTQHYRTAWRQHFGALRLLRNEMKIQVDFSVLTGNAAPWQRFGSVACSAACRVACSVAWVLWVVCSVACGSCHVAYFASCSALCAGEESGALGNYEKNQRWMIPWK